VKERRSALFGVATTVLIAVCLLVPLGFRLMTNIEPFPAMLFPSGGQTVPVTGTEVFLRDIEVIGYKPTGQPQVISPSDVSRVMPEFSYIFAQVAGQDFGLDTTNRIAFNVKGLNETFTVPRHVPSDEARAQAKRWLKSRLQRLGLSTTRLAVRDTWLTIRYKTGQVVSKKVINEHIIQLD
jgi:hypothetical protein